MCSCLSTRHSIKAEVHSTCHRLSTSDFSIAKRTPLLRPTMRAYLVLLLLLPLCTGKSHLLTSLSALSSLPNIGHQRTASNPFYLTDKLLPTPISQTNCFQPFLSLASCLSYCCHVSRSILMPCSVRMRVEE